jgi:hypothetical protein
VLKEHNAQPMQYNPVKGKPRSMQYIAFTSMMICVTRRGEVDFPSRSPIELIFPS